MSGHLSPPQVPSPASWHQVILQVQNKVSIDIITLRCDLLLWFIYKDLIIHPDSSLLDSSGLSEIAKGVTLEYSDSTVFT